MRRFPFLVAVSAMMLAACGPRPSDEEPPPAGGTADHPAIAAVAPEAVVEAGPYTLKVKPGYVYRCPGRDRTAAQVSWKVTDPGVGEKVEVLVYGRGESEAKLFTRGGLEGAADTGDWVFEETRFVLARTDGTELASYVVGGLPCGD